MFRIMKVSPQAAGLSVMFEELEGTKFIDKYYFTPQSRQRIFDYGMAKGYIRLANIESLTSRLTWEVIARMFTFDDFWLIIHESPDEALSIWQHFARTVSIDYYQKVTAAIKDYKETKAL